MFSRKDIKYEALSLPDRMTMSDNDMLEEAKAFYNKMKRRHSVRDYSPRSVPQAVIENCIRAAGTAPSGANHQPWHFVAVSNPEIKHDIRLAAEKEERHFYAGGGGNEWISALEPIGTTADKPHLDIAPWLIIVFAQKWGYFSDNTRYKNYYVSESVGIATGMLLTALHHSGLVTLTHTPNPMAFLNTIFGRAKSEKPVMIIAVGHPSEGATVPNVAKMKKPLDKILTIYP